MNKTLTTLNDRMAVVEEKQEEKGSDETDSDEYISADSEAEEEVSVKKKKQLTMDRRIKARLRHMRLVDSDDSDDDGREMIYDTKGTKGKKSGRAKTAKDVAKKAIDWPQYYVYRGAARNTPAFDELKLDEFTAGFLSVLQASKDPQEVKNIQLLHLQKLMTDTQTYPWEVVRNFHGILLQQMEQRRLTWSDSAKIQELRAVYLVQAVTEKKSERQEKGGQTSGNNATKSLRYCYGFQNGSCSIAYTPHDTDKSGKVHHICAYCYRYEHAVYYHAENMCRRKKPAPKNGQSESPQE
jgi:hypothetical protein